jgi:predicted nucleic acid-binding protein
VTQYLLDTNIISNVTRAVPSPHLLLWLGEQADQDLYVASLTVAEIWRGILELPRGKKRHALETWFFGSEGPQALFAGRVLPFDEKAALAWGKLMAEGKAAGRPRSALDMIVAAIAATNGCTIVTDNERDFTGIDAINPLRQANGQGAPSAGA